MITTEIRYFYRLGTLPAKEIIAKLALKPQETRTDVYFPFQACDTASFKLRENRAEAKICIGNTIIDHTEWSHWEKAAMEAPGCSFDQESIEVEKKRWLTFFDTDMERAEAARPLVCQVEYCAIKVREMYWESLCLEVSGTDADERTEVAATVWKEVLKRNKILREVLSDENRKSYPVFILEVSSRAAGR